MPFICYLVVTNNYFRHNIILKALLRQIKRKGCGLPIKTSIILSYQICFNTFFYGYDCTVEMLSHLINLSAKVRVICVYTYI